MAEKQDHLTAMKPGESVQDYFVREVLKAKPVYEDVAGAPVTIGQAVTVANIDGGEVDERFIGMSGVVEYLEYSCGCGQKYPGDPMIGVRFPCRTIEEFWAEELGLVSDQGVEPQVRPGYAEAKS